MKIKWIVLGLTVIYVAAMITGYFTVPAFEPQFPVPEYIKLSTYNGSETMVHIYEKKSRYYIEYPLADEKHEITREEYIRCAAINPDNFELAEENKLSNFASMIIQIKYPDEKEEKYTVYTQNVAMNPCWQLIWFRTLKYGEERKTFETVLALEETFDKYRIENGAFLCTSTISQSKSFYYGDMMEVIYGKKDCFDEDIYYKLMAELCMMNLYQEDLIDEKDLTDDFDKMCDVIEDTTDLSLEEYITANFSSNSTILYDSNKTTAISDLYFYLTNLIPGYNKTLEKDSQEKLLEEKYIYTGEYAIEGYYRVIEDDDQIIILFADPYEKNIAVVVAQSNDPLTKRGFIRAVVETYMDCKDEAPSGHPYENTHRIARASVITSVFIFLLAVLLVVSFITGRKKKKAALAIEGSDEAQTDPEAVADASYVTQEASSDSE